MSAAPRTDLTIIPEERYSDRLTQAIYDKLLLTAQQLMWRERRGHTMQADDLVHEVLLRLHRQGALKELSESQLYAAALHAMPQVLVDHARRRNAAKRLGHWTRVPLEENLKGFDTTGEDAADLRELLDTMALKYPRQAKVVMLRFFEGQTTREIAAALSVSDTAVETYWRFAKAWLRGRFEGPEA